MSRMKTMLIGLITGLTVSTAAIADPNLPRVFAGCIGRFSAQMEHAWLVGDMSAAEEHKTLRAMFLTMLDATVTDDQRRDMLHYRIDAKMAQAALLTRATFGRDHMRAQDAGNRATYYLSACREMLLDS